MRAAEFQESEGLGKTRGGAVGPFAAVPQGMPAAPPPPCRVRESFGGAAARQNLFRRPFVLPPRGVVSRIALALLLLLSASAVSAGKMREMRGVESNVALRRPAKLSSVVDLKYGAASFATDGEFGTHLFKYGCAESKREDGP